MMRTFIINNMLSTLLLMEFNFKIFVSSMKTDRKQLLSSVHCDRTHYFPIHFQIDVSLPVSKEDYFTLAPMYRLSRKYMCCADHVFLIRLNVVTGSSNQPWVFTHFFLVFFLCCPTNRNSEVQVLLLFLHMPCRNSK